MAVQVSISKKRRFDLSHINVSEELQGAQIASFRRRSFAYLIDWIIIIACTRLFWLVIPLTLLLLMWKKRLFSSRKQLFSAVATQLNKAREKLDDLDVNREVTKRFVRYLTVYIQVLTYAIPAVSLIGLAGVMGGYFNVNYEDSDTSPIGHLLGGTFQSFGNLYGALNAITGVVGSFLYFTLFTWKWQGQTPGKRFTGISVAKLNGEKISLWGSFERVSGYAASASLLLAGFFQYFWDKNNQTTHDKISETIVIKVEKPISTAETPVTGPAQ